MGSKRDESTPEPEAGTPLYVHLPFCAAKCHYCDFFSLPDEGQDVEGTVRAISAEARERAPWRPRTVYLGGGTPSLLERALLKELFDTLDDVSGFRASADEVNVECNPESLDLDKARSLLELGATRVSIGFQSLHDEVLQLFGRVHTVEDSFRAYEAARQAGFGRVNVDLIFAAPGQDPAQWERDLERVLALGPDHLSAYNLTYEEETLFKRWLDQGRLERTPEEVELQMFAATRRLARARGLEPYEVSNFAASGQECRHNVNYWHNGPYVGIGPSAVSKVGATRFGNQRALAAYRRAVERGRPAVAWEETPGDLGRLGESWWLGLRLAEGLTAAEARERAGLAPAPADGDPATSIARRLVDAGLLAEDGGRYRLTERGWPLADAVAREFLGLAPEAPGAPAFGPAPRHESDTAVG